MQWAAGASEAELQAIASRGDDVARLLRMSRFDGSVEVWHTARLGMQRVVDLGELLPSADGMLRAAARRVMSVPGVPPPPRHAFAAPGTELPDDIS